MTSAHSSSVSLSHCHDLGRVVGWGWAYNRKGGKCGRMKVVTKNIDCEIVISSKIRFNFLECFKLEMFNNNNDNNSIKNKNKNNKDVYLHITTILKTTTTTTTTTTNSNNNNTDNNTTNNNNNGNSRLMVTFSTKILKSLKLLGFVSDTCVFSTALNASRLQRLPALPLTNSMH